MAAGAVVLLGDVPPKRRSRRHAAHWSAGNGELVVISVGGASVDVMVVGLSRWFGTVPNVLDRRKGNDRELSLEVPPRVGWQFQFRERQTLPWDTCRPLQWIELFDNSISY